MRNPIRSESDAFYLALGGSTLTGASIALGALVNPIAGGALFAGGLIGAFVWELSTKDPDRRQPLREAAAAGRLSPASPLLLASTSPQRPAILRQLRIPFVVVAPRADDEGVRRCF